MGVVCFDLTSQVHQTIMLQESDSTRKPHYHVVSVSDFGNRIVVFKCCGS